MKGVFWQTKFFKDLQDACSVEVLGMNWAEAAAGWDYVLAADSHLGCGGFEGAPSEVAIGGGLLEAGDVGETPGGLGDFDLSWRRPPHQADRAP